MQGALCYKGFGTRENEAQVSTSGSGYVITFDVGGSHIGAGLCRLADLEIEHSASGPLEGVNSFDGFAELVARLGREAAHGETGIDGASLAVPGPFDLTNGISLIQHKLQFLYKKDLRGALAQRFGWKAEQVRFLNDAAAYVLGEVGRGSLRGTMRSVGLTLGTGVGCAFVVNGKHVTSGDGVPPGGEIWNFPYEGRTVEDLISTRAIKSAFEKRTGASKEVFEIAELAAEDKDARVVWDGFGDALGRVLRDVIAPFRPERVMVGGGIARSAELFLPAAERVIAGLGFSAVTDELDGQAPLVGAGQYWREEMRKEVSEAAKA